MSTHCNISVRQPDGSFIGIYCHSDGYREYTGDLLLRLFNTEEAANALVAIGDISFIEPDGSVFAYHRDRGEAWERVKPATTADLPAMVAWFKQAASGWFYSWFDGQWNFISPGDTTWRKLTPCTPPSRPS